MVMKKDVKKTTEKYVTEKTFEKSMTNIAKSFAQVDESLELHSKILQDILKEIKQINEDNKYFRQSISNLNIDGSSSDRKIEDLTMRVERLEMKVK